MELLDGREAGKAGKRAGKEAGEGAVDSQGLEGIQVCEVIYMTMSQGIPFLYMVNRS